MSESRVLYSDIVMDSAQAQIHNRILQARPGAVFTPKDFLDLASRDAADQTLSRLVRQAKVRRLGRGLYYTPRHNETLGVDVPPDLDDVADAVARQTGSRVAPSGAVAANRLGLSTQVPVKPVYLSDGRTRQVAVGNYTLQIKHVSPKDLPVGSRTSALVLQALRFLGKDAIHDGTIGAIRSALSRDDRAQLLHDAQYATDWLREIARRVASESETVANG